MYTTPTCTGTQGCVHARQTEEKVPLSAKRRSTSAQRGLQPRAFLVHVFREIHKHIHTHWSSWSNTLKKANHFCLLEHHIKPVRGGKEGCKEDIHHHHQQQHRHSMKASIRRHTPKIRLTWSTGTHSRIDDIRAVCVRRSPLFFRYSIISRQSEQLFCWKALEQPHMGRMGKRRRRLLLCALPLCFPSPLT